LEHKKLYVSRGILFRIVDVLLEHGVRRISIGGGEPLCSKDVYAVGAYIKKAKAETKTLLRTSGCKPFELNIIEKTFDVIDISIDSTSNKHYNRCKPNSDINVVLKNIEDVQKFTLMLRCNVLVTKFNYDDIIRTVNHLIQLGVKNIRMQHLVPRGLAKDIYSELNVSNDDYCVIIEKLQVIAHNANVNISEQRSAVQRALCIVKPNGYTYIANPCGLEYMGVIFEPSTLTKVGEQLYNVQKVLYCGRA
jgi:MoaA/NifB/PqqE/SkfB family radical SAM enzyme